MSAREFRALATDTTGGQDRHDGDHTMKTSHESLRFEQMDPADLQLLANGKVNTSARRNAREATIRKELDLHEQWRNQNDGRRFCAKELFKDCDYRGLDLSHANLGEADLQGANFEGANLRHANLRHADLRTADLRNADLRSASLSCAQLDGAFLRNADLRDVVLDHVDFTGAVELNEALVENRETIDVHKRLAEALRKISSLQATLAGVS